MKTNAWHSGIIIIIIIIITRIIITRIVITRIIILHSIYGNTDSNTISAPALARQWRSNATMEPTAATRFIDKSTSLSTWSSTGS